MPEFGIVVFTSRHPKGVARLMQRLRDEIPGVAVRGILYELRPGKTIPQRAKIFLRNLREWEFGQYAALRILSTPLRALSQMAHLLLRFIHACPKPPNDSAAFSIDDLGRSCHDFGCSLLVTPDIHSPQALDLARRLQADLGIVYATRILKPELFKIPRLGSINIHKRKVPDYRGGGPVGLWELLDNEQEIGITVHCVEKDVDTGAVVRAATIPIEPLDTLTSLDAKADVMGDDLLVAAVADFAAGTVHALPQQGKGRTFKGPKPHQLRRYQKQVAARRAPAKSMRGYPAHKLLGRTLLLAPYITLRNWARYRCQSFPVTILFHHVVTDRPHFLGICTDQFLKQIEFLKKHYRIVSLGEAIQMLNSNTVEQPTLVLTFDDGYQDNFLNLRAVMQQTDVPVTLFVCTEHATNQQEFAHDVKGGARNFLPLTWDQLTYLSLQGVEIGSHTRSHFDCGATDPAALQNEIVKSKEELENRLNRPIPYFSFPLGQPENMSRPAVELARATYSYVLSAYGGMNFPSGRGQAWHLRRCGHPGDLWELELMLQSALELRTKEAQSVLEAEAAPPASRKSSGRGVSWTKRQMRTS